MSTPWGVHTIKDIYSKNVTAGLPEGLWVWAVAEPYTANRLVAAWWVLTGRAYALQWPRTGDLEDTLGYLPRRGLESKQEPARNRPFMPNRWPPDAQQAPTRTQGGTKP